MGKEEPIRITIFALRENERCYTGGWGSILSSEETAELYRRYLQKLHGDRVAVEYIDLADPAAAAYPEVHRMHRSGEAALPYAYLDGSLRWTGSDPWDRIMAELSARLPE